MLDGSMFRTLLKYQQKEFWQRNPVISFNTKTSTDEQKKHDDFVDRMMEKGYTRKQVRLLCEW